MIRVITLIFLSALCVSVVLNIFTKGKESFQTRQQPDRQKREAENETTVEEETTTFSPATISINRCCPAGEELNDQHQCVDGFNSADDEKRLSAFLEHRPYLVDENLIRLTTNMSRVELKDFGEMCRGGQRRVIQWYEDKPNRYFISAGNGSLIELTEDRSLVSTVYSNDKFCIGPYEDRIIGILCPCGDKLCVPKCCPTGHYFDLTENRCQQDVGNIVVPPLELVFYEVAQEVASNVSHLLLQSYPKCDRPDRMTENNQILYLQEDSMLMLDSPAREQFHFYKTNQYCIDVFSDGNVSLTNGFYCDGETDIVFSYEDYNKTNQVKQIRGAEGEQRRKQEVEEEEEFNSGRGEGQDQLKKDIEQYEQYMDAREGDGAKLIVSHVLVLVVATVALM